MTRCARAHALLGLVFAAFACEGTFAFDSGTPFGMGGVAGVAAVSGGAPATSGAAGSNAGSAGALDCEVRCGAAQLTCLESRQLCVECVKDEDCLSRGGRRCGVSGQTSNRCLECLSDADCGSGKQCEPNTHSCVTTCARDHDPVCAGTGFECATWHTYCAACYHDDDCKHLGLRCSVGDARCVQCVEDAQCATEPGKWCDPVTFSCVVCRDSSDCASSNETCDPDAHVCH